MKRSQHNETSRLSSLKLLGSNNWMRHLLLFCTAVVAILILYKLARVVLLNETVKSDVSGLYQLIFIAAGALIFIVLTMLREIIGYLFPHSSKNKAEIISEGSAQSDISSIELVGRDNILALAKLRFDIERELRNLARRAGETFHVAPLDIIKLSELLAKKAPISKEDRHKIYSITEQCNHAIHNKEISTDEALAIVRTGNELLEHLRSLSDPKSNKVSLEDKDIAVH